MREAILTTIRFSVAPSSVEGLEYLCKMVRYHVSALRSDVLTPLKVEPVLPHVHELIADLEKKFNSLAAEEACRFGRVSSLHRIAASAIATDASISDDRAQHTVLVSTENPRARPLSVHFVIPKMYGTRN